MKEPHEYTQFTIRLKITIYLKIHPRHEFESFFLRPQQD